MISGLIVLLTGNSLLLLAATRLHYKQFFGIFTVNSATLVQKKSAFRKIVPRETIKERPICCILLATGGQQSNFRPRGLRQWLGGEFHK